MAKPCSSVPRGNSLPTTMKESPSSIATAPRRRIDLRFCNPTGAAPVGAPALRSIETDTSATPAAILTRNLSADGNRVFFETPDKLVAMTPMATRVVTFKDNTDLYTRPARTFMSGRQRAPAPAKANSKTAAACTCSRAAPAPKLPSSPMPAPMATTPLSSLSNLVGQDTDQLTTSTTPASAAASLHRIHRRRRRPVKAKPARARFRRRRRQNRRAAPASPPRQPKALAPQQKNPQEAQATQKAPCGQEARVSAVKSKENQKMTARALGAIVASSLCLLAAAPSAFAGTPAFKLTAAPVRPTSSPALSFRTAHCLRL